MNDHPSPTRGTPAAGLHVLGWDVGGAHLKAALFDPRGRLLRVEQLACPLWTGMDQLHAATERLLAALPDVAMLHAVTMTGEMADMFADRGEGVRTIVAWLRGRLEAGRGETLRLFAGARGFVAASECDAHVDAIASANWHATAQWCARQLDAGILVDIGSTTTDLIPFAGGEVHAIGSTDAGRLDHGELAYVGIVRTPLMGMAERAPIAGHWRPTIKEYYATTADVFRVLRELDESCDVQPTADNGPKSIEGSARRMLRGIGLDLDPGTMAAARDLALWYRERLLDETVATLHLRLSRGDVDPSAALVGAGIGREFVIEVARRLRRACRGIEDLLCPPDTPPQLRAWAAHCAPALAVALLAQDERRSH